MSAILKITDGTTEVSLINGPIYLESWLPSIPDYKGGGVFADSPIGESRRIVYKQFGSVTEAMNIKIANNTQDDTIRALRNLQALLESAANYWISPWSTTPVYLVAKASRESSARYATIIKGRIPNLGPVMAQPFTNCANPVLDNMSLAIERNHWNPTAPGSGGSAVSLSADIQHNVVGNQSFEQVTFSANDPTFSATGGPSTFELSTEQVLRDGVSLKVIAAGADEGAIYNDMHWTEASVEYTFTVWVYVTSGIVAAAISDDTGFTNVTSTVSTTTGQWEQLTVTGSVATQGMWLLVRSSGGAATFYVDDARLYPRSGMTNSTVPAATEFFVSNKQREDGIGHVYLYDNGTWSNNLLYEATPQVIMGRTNDNAVYFGIDASDFAAPAVMGNGGPFDNIIFNISKAIGGTSVALVWEYLGSGWTSIPGIVDRTDSFSETGINSVTWRPPTDWSAEGLRLSLSVGEGSAAGAPDVEAYWVRLRKTAGTISAAQRPEIATPFPYTVTWPYVNLGTTASPVGGDLVASAKIKVKNYGGELAQSLETEVAAQNDDTWFERPIDVNQSASTVLKVGEDWTSGMRFLGLPIEPSSTILSAKIALVSNTTGTGVVRSTISAHDVDDSGALNGYNLAAWEALPRTYIADINNLVSWSLEGTTLAGQVLLTPDFSNVVQAIVDRAGWVSGNDVTIFIEEDAIATTPPSDAGAKYEFASFDNVTYDAPTLTVVWQDSKGGVWLNKCVAGVRDTARGSDFISHINMSDWQKQVGISVVPNDKSYFEDNIRAAGNRLITIDASEGGPWPPSIPFFPNTEDVWNIIINIDGTLAASYIGDFRAFLRVSTDLGTGETADFSIAVQSGSSGLVKYGHTSAEFRFAETVGEVRDTVENNIIPVDLGLIKIPGNPLSDYNELSLFISGRASVASKKLNVYDLILIPADEWIGEIATAPGHTNAVISLESMYFDSVANEKKPVSAYHTTSGDSVKALLSAFSQRVLISHTNTQRMYFMFNTIERDDSSTTFGERSSPWAFAGVSVSANRKYLSLRGDDS